MMNQDNSPQDAQVFAAQVFAANSFALEIAGLAYLAHLMNAPTLIGLDDEQLFPADDGQRRTLDEAGLQSLKAHGWMQVDAEANLDLNPTLALMVASMAAPQYVLMTTRFVDRERQQELVHYLADEMIVEQFQSSDGRVQLRALRDPMQIVQQIAALLALDISSAQPVPDAPRDVAQLRRYGQIQLGPVDDAGLHNVTQLYLVADEVDIWFMTNAPATDAVAWQAATVSTLASLLSQVLEAE